MSVVDDTRSTIGFVRDKDVPFKAASIAYYAIASIIPLLVLALALLSVFGAVDLLVDVLRSNLSQSGTQVLNKVLSNTSGRGAAGVFGFLLTLWSAMKVFRGLTVAFDELYEVTSDLSIVEQVKKSLIVIGVLTGAFALLSATSVALTYVNFSIPYPTLFGNLAAILVLVVAFLPLYYVLPPVSVSLSHALPGTLVAAVGWVVLQIGFFYYTKTAGAYAAYGFFGAILLFITFLYLAAIVVLLGAVVNIVLD
jgi:membrane protein